MKKKYKPAAGAKKKYAHLLRPCPMSAEGGSTPFSIGGGGVKWKSSSCKVVVCPLIHSEAKQRNAIRKSHRIQSSKKKKKSLETTKKKPWKHMFVHVLCCPGKFCRNNTLLRGWLFFLERERGDGGGRILSSIHPIK